MTGKHLEVRRNFKYCEDSLPPLRSQLQLDEDHQQYNGPPSLTWRFVGVVLLSVALGCGFAAAFLAWSIVP